MVFRWVDRGPVDVWSFVNLNVSLWVMSPSCKYSSFSIRFEALSRVLPLCGLSPFSLFLSFYVMSYFIFSSMEVCLLSNRRKDRKKERKNIIEVLIIFELVLFVLSKLLTGNINQKGIITMFLDNFLYCTFIKILANAQI